MPKYYSVGVRQASLGRTLHSQGAIAEKALSSGHLPICQGTQRRASEPDLTFW